MKIKTLTWNIGGGKILRDGTDDQLMASYSVDGLDKIINFLKKERPDIITLQETQKNEKDDQVARIAEQIGYAYVHDSTSDSHIDAGYQLGHAILTPHTITNHTAGLFVNPNATITWEDGNTATSFDKGYTTCTIAINDVPITVTTLHLVPFKRFAIALDSDQAKKILADVQSKISSESTQPHIIQGDFNIDSKLLQPYLATLFKDDTDEVALSQPTTPQHQMYDHIIVRHGTITDHTVASSIKTDHYPVTAVVEIAN